MRNFYAASITYCDVIYICFKSIVARNAYVSRMNAKCAPFDKGYSYTVSPARVNFANLVNYQE